jgi:hypothetical protein
MCSPSINATAARLLDRNARLWEPVLASRKGRAALVLGSFASIGYMAALRLVLLFAVVGAAYVFDVLFPADPALQEYGWIASVFLASAYVVLIPVFLLVVVGGLSVIAAMITLDRRRQERAA